MEKTDAELMRAVQNGSVPHLDALFVRHHRRLFTFCYHLTGSRDAAEDAVQDVFLRVLEYRGTFKPGSSFAGWVFTIARNVVLRTRERDRAMTSLSEHHAVVDEPQAAGEALEREEQLRRLQKALDRLDPETKELLLKARLERQSYSAVAQHLGVTEGAVKVRVFRAMKRLRDAFDALEQETDHGLP